MYKNEQVTRRYSEGFKLKILAELSTGKYSKRQLTRIYGLQSSTINEWIKKYDRKDLMNTRIMVENKDEISRLKALQDKFVENNLKVGRDSLFDILRENNMLVERKKSFVKTTNSYHRFHKYNNLIYDIIPTKANQVWVSDITYIRTVNGFCYLALITDMYSRKIVGVDISNSLELAGCLRSLKKAQRLSCGVNGLVHRPDRGIQYCSNQYVNELKKKKIKISMT